MIKPRWTAKEVEQLKRLYATTHMEQLCLCLRRKPMAISVKANRLGLKAIRPYHYKPELNSNLYHNLTDSQRGYVAGIIDGEGYIQIMKGRSGIRVNVTNTTLLLLEYLKTLLGGYIIHSHKKTKPNHKQGYRWCLNSGVRCYHLLSVLMPFLIVKKDKAEKAIYSFGTRSLKGVSELKVNLI